MTDLEIVNRTKIVCNAWSKLTQAKGGRASALLRLAKFKGVPGNCYEDVSKMLKMVAGKLPGARAVHGFPTLMGGPQEGKVYGHAWLEYNHVEKLQSGQKINLPMVVDHLSSSNPIPRALYYHIGKINPKENTRYNLEGLYKEQVKHQHYGPYNTKEGTVFNELGIVCNKWTPAAWAAAARARHLALVGKKSHLGHYFQLSHPGTKIVSIYRLVPSKPPESQPKSVRHAEGAMKASKMGILDKRKPLSVRKLSNGKYIVVDGNATYGASFRNGFTHLPVIVTNKWTHEQAVAGGRARWKNHEMVPAIRVGKGKKAKVMLMNGHEAPAHIKLSMVSPAWKDVKISLHPDSKLLVTGKDVKGRQQRLYHPEFVNERKLAKFARVSALLKVHEAVGREIKSHFGHPDSKISEAAHVAHLIYERGVRPGGEGKTLADKKAFGATTLRAEHVQQYQNGDTRLSFIGKKGVRNLHRISGELSEHLQQRAKERGGKGRLYDVSASKLREYMGKLDGGGFHPKDFRTARATIYAQSLVGTKPRTFKSERLLKQEKNKVAKKVSELLNNQPSEALRSYIHPAVFDHWTIKAPRTKKGG